MQIRDLARLAQLTPRQLRRYEREGLIRPATIAQGQPRYAAQTAPLVRRINVLVDLGFTTGEIRTFLDRIDDQPSEHCAPVSDLQGRRIAKIDAVIAKLKATRAELVGLLVTDEALDVQDQATAVRRQ
ncbi:MerR family transcriptional regulator [Caulobacter henricii]|uniref:HTH merR-type domain-containing protein n=1 Tax=Caulobacter henricii TaxID=69395 RepID=A0A0P0P4C1_9CAUL|nr:MerR family transcriptional regulator [Caulobacter henricii]ALL15459.1 hypothetical protein AQ619_18410 [Caulobacter henricii]